VDEIVKEREIRGPFVTLEDFVDRTSNKEVNKRTVESFIKSGALDGLPGTRKQKFLVSAQLIDEKAKEKKNSMEGQMSLFDFVGEEEKSDFQISFPNVGEYSKEELLAFEKEMLGVYVSGHPMEAYEECWRKNITAMSSDFTVDEETGEARVTDGQYVTIGGMITAKTVKTTRTNKMMAFVTIEDLTGQVEVLVFPKDYEKKREFLNPDEKVFIRGRVSIGEEPVGKMICEQVIPFSDVPRELWLQYPSREIYLAREEELLDTLRMYEGKDSVIIYLEAERAKKLLPMNWNVSANPELVQQLIEKLGERNVKVIEKPIEKIRRMH
ncbi:MAG: OB-fold nucleic acid binding domain-containing protein, partial [Clostridium sp.]